MSIDTYKAQARRLQAFLKSSPLQAAALTEGKHAPCLEAIAAVHGARNWNTLQASCAAPEPETPVFLAKGLGSLAALSTVPPASVPVLSSVPLGSLGGPNPDVGAIWDGVRPGHVQYVLQESDNAQINAVDASGDVVEALEEGYAVTILQVGVGFNHLALAFGGAAVSASMLRQDVSSWDKHTLALSFGGWQLTNLMLGAGAGLVPQRWGDILPILNGRTGVGHLVVVADLPPLMRIFGDKFELFTEFVQQARKRGTIFNILSPEASAFDALRVAVPPNHELISKALS